MLTASIRLRAHGQVVEDMTGLNAKSSLRLPPAGDGSLGYRIRSELLQSMTRLGGLVLWIDVGAAGAALHLLWPLAPVALIRGWLAVIGVALFARAAVYVRWMRARNKHQPSPAWERSLALAALFEGMAWGGLSWFETGAAPATSYLLATIVTTVAFAGIPAFGQSRLAGPYYLVPIVLGQTVAYATSNAAGASTLLFLWLLLAGIGLTANMLSAKRYRLSLYERMVEEASAAEQRTLLDTLTVGVVVTDGGVIQDCNERITAMLGYSREELIGKPAEMLALSAEEHAQNEALVRDILEGRNASARVQKRRRKDNSVLAVEVNAGLVDPADPASPIVTVLEDITLRLSTERELSVSRERLRLALDALQSGVWDADLVGNRFFYSRRFRSLLGFDLSSVEPLPQRVFFHHEMIHPDDRGRVDEERMLTLTQGVPFDVQYRVRVGLDTIWLRETAIAVSGVAGGVDRLTGSITDTTAMNQIQEQLKASEIFHRGLVDASNTCIWRCDPDGITTFVNDRGARDLYGFEPHQMVGHHVYECIAPEAMSPEVRAMFEPVLKGATVRNVELVHMTKSKRRIFVSINAVPLFDSEGKIEGVMGITTDITHVKRRERAFQDATRLQRLIFDAAGEGIVLVRDGRIYRVNQAFADLIGVTIGELVTRPLGQYFAEPAMWEQVEKQLDEHRAVIKVEQSLTHSNGRALWVAVTGRSIEMDDIGVLNIWVFADISDRKAQEQQSWYSANHDELTGLPNRRLLQDRFEQSLARVRRESGRLALLMLDLDGFKAINDEFGHHAGDEVLKQIAERLTRNVRQLDTVARLGGDEFVIVLHQFAGSTDLEQTARRVIEQVGEPMQINDSMVSVNTSVGIAIFPDSADGVVGLMHAADFAMYAAKGAGKNTFRIAEPSMRSLTRSKSLPG
jgi:diguanylate cyclase (GGDEF)-like protein/PAS domain S-box-containing protein